MHKLGDEFSLEVDGIATLFGLDWTLDGALASDLTGQLTERDLRDIRRRSGDDVWRGPLADRCRDEVLIAQRRLDLAVDDLRRHALVLERQADEIDLRAAATAGFPA